MSRSRIYDNWERLVAATLRREQLWQLCHAHSREPSIVSSRFSDFSCPSPLPSVPFDSWYKQNSSVPSNIRNGFKVESSQALAPEEIFVNGEPLSPEKLNILLSCTHPPKKLRPGYYWYDKVSGFWGKTGQKPSQIISPSLNVGGRLGEYSSNGNTGIFINGRGATKVEQRMLKFAGVRCSPNTHIWMDGHGFYQFEGHKNVRGCIWDKVGMKLLCSVLSLPFPPRSSNYTSGSEQIQSLEQNGIQKLLLIGCNGSGTSTIFKQAAELSQPDCKPSYVDIDRVTSSIRLSCLDFSFPESANTYDDAESVLRFKLIRLQVKDFGESSLWLPKFEDVQIVLFCVSLSDYDQFSIDDDGSSVNKMLLSKRFFEEMVTNPTFDQIDFLLILNKYDLFEKNIAQVPLSQCDWFDDFHPVTRDDFHTNNSNGLLPIFGQLCFHYIAGKFKRLYFALTCRKLYVSLVSSLEPNSVDAALKYAREILKWNEVKNNYSLSWNSSYSSDSSNLSD